MRKRNNTGKLGTLALVINFFIEFLILMSVFVSVGILIQSTILISLGFIIAILLTLIINYFAVRPAIVYIVSLPVLVIILIFVPKILL